MPRHKLGFGKPGVFTIKYNYEQNIFNPNDEVTVKVAIDNTQCEQAVRNFKTRLYRKIIGVVHSKNGPIVFNTTKIVNEMIFPGIPAKTKVDNLELKIKLIQLKDVPEETKKG